MVVGLISIEGLRNLAASDIVRYLGPLVSSNHTSTLGNNGPHSLSNPKLTCFELWVSFAK